MRKVSKAVGSAILVGVCATMISSLPAQATERRSRHASPTLTVTMFNIEFYGRGGEVDGAMTGSDRRNATIKAHLDNNNLWTDVMSFEEIVDVEAFKRDITGSRYNCESYDHANAGHQHVVLCARTGLRLVKADDDDNFTLENVAMERLRPAVHAIVETTRGERLAHVVAVHLKAQEDQSDTRLEQVQMIADYLYEREDDLPVILMGDANTFNDDPTLMGDILDEYGVDMVEINNPAAATYRTPTIASKLDRIWVSKTVRVVTTPKVYGPCTGDGWTGTIADYNHKVSDHCPVTVKLGL